MMRRTESKNHNLGQYETNKKDLYHFLMINDIFSKMELIHQHMDNAFIKCSDSMDDVYENINDYNSSRKREILTVFDDMIADIMTN